MIGTPILFRLGKETRGVALIEFAMVLPVLLMLFLASYQISDALACNRKVTITARAVADLTTQSSTLTSTQQSDILNASSKIMAPYKSSNALVRVTELYTDASGNTTVQWSNAINGSKRAAGSAYTLPPSIKILKTYMVVAEVNYAYTPAVNFGIVGPLSLSDVIYMNPRVSDSVNPA
ncbi:TadE/TadG family type IV pilus assembly protein [Sphingomonas oryzagri]